MILDGDLPGNRTLSDTFSTRMSEADGKIHIVNPGRIIGLSSDDFKVLAAHDIHFHVYYGAAGNLFKIKQAFPHHFHIHNPVEQRDWVKEFSRYAGWLHSFHSSNDGNIMRASWDDLNIPARINTLAFAGLSMIQKDNNEHIVSAQSIASQLGTGFFYKDIEELAYKLRDKNLLEKVRAHVIMNRQLFTFNHHIEDLVKFFITIIQMKAG